MKNKIILLVVLLLIGCSTKKYYWYNNNGNNFKSDDYLCEISARQNTQSIQYGIAFDDVRYEREKSELYDKCMYAQGWYTSEK